MSWLFSQALVEEYLGESSSDGEPSAPSSGNPTPQAYCAPDKTMAFSRLSRFGMTFKPLTEDRGEALLMSYLAAFPARTSQSPEKGSESMESAAECGSTWRGWLAKYDPDTSSWRTAQCSLLEDSTECLQTFPRSGMTRGGLLWELPMLALRTNATGSGLWPTPVKSDSAARRPSKGWAGTDLPSVVWRRNGGDQNPIKPPAKLNARWVEWLMGWPAGWTSLQPLATVKFRSAPQQPGDI
jgi:hypothetical protein